jgi:hypothetical protein
MEELNFAQIVGDTVSLAGHSFDTRACPDQYLGMLSGIIGKPHFPLRVAADERTEQPCLVIILESPHIDEFIGDPGPARGFTGDMIRNYLHESINLQEVDGFGLVLINAIQHQCSLGNSTSEHRDKIFRSVWARGGQENFEARLRSVLRPGDVVMNCCTKGNDFELNTPLRSLVEASTRLQFPEVQTVRRMHPASWRTKSWRGVAWRYSTEIRDDSDVKTKTRLNAEEFDLRNIVPQPQLNMLKKLDLKEHAAFKAETETAERESSVALLSTPDALVCVKENEMVRGSSCTVLLMGDGSQRHMKTSTFDPDGSITTKAKSLVGSRIRTTCWDPKDSLGRWSSQGYFRNIYAAE